jgi:Calcium-activated chloride channel
MALWATMFLEFWKRHNAATALRWGVIGAENEEELEVSLNYFNFLNSNCCMFHSSSVMAVAQRSIILVPISCTT